MSAHTKGPWRSATDRCGIPSHVAAETGAVCNFGTAVRRSRGTEEIEANARLISAAPDMLTALRRASLALAFAAESSPAMRDDYEAVSAAIAKATGATQ